MKCRLAAVYEERSRCSEAYKEISEEQELPCVLSCLHVCILLEQDVALRERPAEVGKLRYERE